MQLVERHITVGNPNIEGLCLKSALLYNVCTYHLRQAYFGKIQKFTEYEFTGLLAEFDDPDYRALPAQTAQQIIKLVFKNWKSFFKATAEYKKHPEKFKGKPSLPKYKKGEKQNIFILTNQQVSLKNGFVHFPKMTNLKPLKTKVDNICQVRIVPQANCHVVEIVYEKQEVVNENLKPENALFIDLGLNNFATLINNVGLPPFIINGRVLKSVNQMFNKTKAKLMSYIGNKGTSNRIKKLSFYRNNFVEDKLHKVSRFIVDYASENNIGTIVIGHNKQWKDGINIGKVNNQKFVCLPHSKLIDKITYKSAMVGIKVVETEESHTSKIDHLAYEELKHQKVYLGKRIKRGLFQSSTGKLINADCNGSIGIARKVLGDSVIPQIVRSGLAFNPIKLNLI